MGAFILIQDYIIWHYGRAVRDFFTVSRDLLWFGYHFFSLPLLTRTLFSPFARIRAGGISITDIEGSVQNITLNLISRAVGFFLRVSIIAIGVISLVMMTPVLAAIFIVWLFLPFIILFLLTFSTGVFA